jgi:hypothetical protein
MSTFSKNKKTGNYDVIGLASEIKPHTHVTVRLKNGSTKDVYIYAVSKPFVSKFGELAGRSVRFGYTTSPDTASKSKSCDECGGAGAQHSRTDSSGISGRVCARCAHLQSRELSFA